MMPWVSGGGKPGSYAVTRLVTARWKPVDLSLLFHAVDLERQLLLGSFPHAVYHLLKNDFDQSGFDARYCNGDAGASSCPPGLAITAILCAYAQGVVFSWVIERLHREPAPLVTLSGDRALIKSILAAIVCGPDGDVAELSTHTRYTRRGMIALRETNPSAICTALSAAPLRMLSATTQRLRPFGTLGSQRKRET